MKCFTKYKSVPPAWMAKDSPHSFWNPGDPSKCKLGSVLP